MADDTVNGFHQIVQEALGLGEDFDDAKGPGATGNVGDVEGGDQDNRHLLVLLGLTKNLEESHPVHSRHHDVKEDQIDAGGVQDEKGFPAVGGGNHFVSGDAQEFPEHHAGVHFIFNNKDSCQRSLR